MSNSFVMPDCLSDYACRINAGARSILDFYQGQILLRSNRWTGFLITKKRVKKNLTGKIRRYI
jgi:hypothetical protein